jgi:hypothetical protein
MSWGVKVLREIGALDPKTVDAVLQRGIKSRFDAGPVAELGDPGLGLLLECIAHPDAQIRDSVVSALSARMSDPKVSERVRAAFHGNDLPARECAERIVKSLPKGTKPPELLAELLRRDVGRLDNGVRESLIEAGSNAVQAVVGLLGDTNGAVRAGACSVLGRMKVASAAPALRRALDDRSVCVRASAAAALGELNDREATPSLIRAMKDPAGAVREEAALALGVLRDPSAVDALAESARQGDWQARRAAAQGLGCLTGDRAVEALVQVAKEDPHWSVRRAAAVALGRQGNASAAPALISAMEDTHWLVRLAACESLAALAGRNLGSDPEAWRSWCRERNGSAAGRKE